VIMPLPIVLVVIDENSRLSILRHEGVMVALLDKRVDPHVVILPQVNQCLEIDEAIRTAAGPYPIISAGWDDAAHTASAAISMLERGRVVVATAHSNDATTQDKG
jgi:hypothetical protein